MKILVCDSTARGCGYIATSDLFQKIGRSHLCPACGKDDVAEVTRSTIDHVTDSTNRAQADQLLKEAEQAVRDCATTDAHDLAVDQERVARGLEPVLGTIARRRGPKPVRCRRPAH